MRLLLLALAALVLLPTASAQERPATERSEALHALFDRYWAWQMEDNPLWATSVGVHDFNDRLPAVSVADAERRIAHQRAVLAEAEAFDADALSPEDRLHHAVFVRQLRDAVEAGRFRDYLMPITNRGGFHVSFVQLGDRVPMRTVRDVENYIARLRAFPAYADGHLDLMRTGVAEGFTLPAIVLDGLVDTVAPHVVDHPTESLLYAPFERLPESIPAAERERLAREGRTAIAEAVVPAYARVRDFFRDEYVPAGRASIAIADTPDGRAYYEHRVRLFTTLDDATPESVHQTGLAEVARIRAEMQEVIDGVGFEGSFDDFVHFLRTDDRFYAETPEELMRFVADIGKRMDGEMPRLFRTLPRMPWGLRPVPDFIAPRTTTAYYQRPAGDGSQAGFYYVNTYDLRSRPLYEVEALTLHEAVPGHHHQIALQQEIEGLPDFRRFGGFTAFVEGWALYAERLGLEVGFYEDPYANFGRLTYEMWRALRLVVDTGMHYFDWDRQRAIDFMAENSALTLHNITTEVDRYISWPGQALAYKTGELLIRELRAEAEAAHGDDFDVRAFHDAVLLDGAVPLSVLADNVRAWIAAGAPR